MSLRPTLAAIVATLLLVAATTMVHAQAPVTPPLEDGDVAWTFAYEDPLFDTCVTGALGTLMAPIIESAAPAGMRIVRVETNGPDFQSATIYPTPDVPKLLEAAGFNSVTPFVQVGTCLYWTPDATDAVAWTSPESPAVVVVEALRDALGSLGLPGVTCDRTDDPAAAHVLFWLQGETPPTLPQRAAPTFLAGTGALPGPTTPPGPNAVPAGPGPAETGMGGPGAETDSSRKALVVLGLVGAVFVAGAGRLATRHRGSR